MAKTTRSRSQKTPGHRADKPVEDAEIMQETPAGPAEPVAADPADPGSATKPDSPAGSAPQADAGAVPGDSGDAGAESGPKAAIAADEGAGHAAEPGAEPEPVSEPETEPETSESAVPPEAPAEPEAGAIEDPEPADEPAAGPQASTAQTPPPTPPVPVQQVTIRRAGFVPLLLGGVLAAAVGYGAHWYLSQGQGGQVAALQTEIAALKSQIAALPPAPEAPDLAPLQSAIAANETGLETLQSTLNAALDESQAASDALDARLTALELAPSADGTLTDNALAAWQSELDGLRASVADQQAQMEQIAALAQSRLDETRSAAAATSAQAEAATAKAEALSAIARIRAALDSGASFSAALGELSAASDLPIEPALSAAAADGVPTLLALQENFPAAARAALQVARDEGLAGEEGGRFMAFLKDQLDIRSTAPQEGETPNAILSRAEAALRAARLSDAIAEVGALPEVVRASMGGWLEGAESRAAALAAADALAAQITAQEG